MLVRGRFRRSDRTHPGDNAGVALVLLNHKLQLALKLGLLLSVGQTRRVGSQARHVLDDEQADLVAGAVEQIRLNLDLRIVSIGHRGH